MLRKQSELYKKTVELIDNDFYRIGIRAGTNGEHAENLAPVSGAGPHATPMKKMQRTKYGVETSY